MKDSRHIDPDLYDAFIAKLLLPTRRTGNMPKSFWTLAKLIWTDRPGPRPRLGLAQFFDGVFRPEKNLAGCQSC